MPMRKPIIIIRIIIIITATITAIIVTRIAEPKPMLCRAAIIAQQMSNPIRTATTSHKNVFGKKNINNHIITVQTKAVANT